MCADGVCPRSALSALGDVRARAALSSARALRRGVHNFTLSRRR